MISRIRVGQFAAKCAHLWWLGMIVLGALGTFGEVRAASPIVIDDPNFWFSVAKFEVDILIDRNHEVDASNLMSPAVQSRFREPSAVTAAGAVSCQDPIWIRMVAESRLKTAVEGVVGTSYLSEVKHVYTGSGGRQPQRFAAPHLEVTGSHLHGPYIFHRIKLHAGTNQIYLETRCRDRFVPKYVLSSVPAITTMSALIGSILGMIAGAGLLLLIIAAAVFYFSGSKMFLFYNTYNICLSLFIFVWYGGGTLYGISLLDPIPAMQLFVYSLYGVEISALAFFWTVLNGRQMMSPRVLKAHYGLYTAVLLANLIWEGPVAANIAFSVGFYFLSFVVITTILLAWRGETLAKILLIMLIPLVFGVTVTLISVLRIIQPNLMTMMMIGLSQAYAILMFSGLIGYRIFQQQKEITELESFNSAIAEKKDLSRQMEQSFEPSPNSNDRYIARFLADDRSDLKPLFFRHWDEKSQSLTIVTGQIPVDALSQGLISLAVKSWLLTWCENSPYPSRGEILVSELFHELESFIEPQKDTGLTNLAVLHLRPDTLSFRLSMGPRLGGWGEGRGQGEAPSPHFDRDLRFGEIAMSGRESWVISMPSPQPPILAKKKVNPHPLQAEARGLELPPHLTPVITQLIPSLGPAAYILLIWPKPESLTQPSGEPLAANFWDLARKNLA